MTSVALAEPVPLSRARRLGARSLTVLGVVLALVSLISVYVHYELIDDATFRETSRLLVQDDAIQQQISTTAVETLFANVDVAARIEARLPPAQKGLAVPIAAALHGVGDRLALQILSRPAMARLLVSSLSLSHDQLVLLLENKGRFTRVDNGVVSVDLRQLVRDLTTQIGLSASVADRIPDSAAEVTVLRSDELKAGQQGVRLLNALAAWLGIVVLATWALAIYLVPGHRRREVRAIAIGIVAIGVLVLLARRMAGTYVVDQLAETESVRPAAQSAYDIVTRHLKDAGVTDLMIGAVALLGVWLVGPRAHAQRVLHWLAPYLRRPALAYGTFAFVWLVLLLWAPTVQFRRGFYVLGMVALSAAGTEVVRRIAARRYPDAQPVAIGAWLSQTWATFTERDQRAPASELSQLATLSDLHDAGKLTDEEFAAAKTRVLA